MGYRIPSIFASLLAVLAVVSVLPASARPVAPVVSLDQDGNRVTVRWDAVIGAVQYRIFYAPFPALAPVDSIDVGTKTAVTVALAPRDSYAVAVVAVGNDGASKLSNIPVARLDAGAAGGALTTWTVSGDAFSMPAPNLSASELDRHRQGNAHFETAFVPAPAQEQGGLGPAFNDHSCANCHPRNGRMPPPGQGKALDTLFLRLSLPGEDPETGGPVAVPGFGTQLFTKAVPGVIPEAMVSVTWTEEAIVLDNGMQVSLRTPHFDTLPYMALPADTLYSPRLGPPVFGRGLLEAVPEATILALADERDVDDDGISGKANRVWHPGAGRLVLGRFGLKANVPDLHIQVADAFHQDIGITSPVFPIESTAGQSQDDTLADDPEIGEAFLQDVTFQMQTLAVPARRNLDSTTVQRGEMLFALAGCTGCHTPTLATGESTVSPALANQVIHPWTDLLLHDMGEGLADHRPDFRADGREWRTPPLWGIGLTELVNSHSTFLHDGRARNLLEAILWHGGEAGASRDFVVKLSRRELDALIAFLHSL